MSRYPMRKPAAFAASSARHRLFRGLGLAALLLALAGCMAPRPGADLPPYGDSVRHTKAIQAYSPGDEVPALNGDKAASAIRAYRTSAGGGSPASGGGTSDGVIGIFSAPPGGSMP
ncbi:hypothetical protein [Billgrantia lactosivorans]|uniref:hypothetical protein n=1 Tax=Billgrantia lactosivorans TaxID=2185141 RepID=UPI000DADD983|nr:hypothetical protein [Halomonas lactosivorans]